MTRRLLPLLGLAALAAFVQPAFAQTASGVRPAPFYPGESMEYAVAYGVLPAGKLEIGIRELDNEDLWRKLQ